QRQVPGEEPDLPTRLDPALIARETLLKWALENPSYADTVQGFTRHAYPWLAGTALDAYRLRNLLRSLELPDIPKLPQLIAADLGAPQSGGFGSLEIHKKLTREQLDALLELKPELLNNGAFIATCVQRLQPDNDQLDWRMLPEVCESYLERLGAFTAQLPPAQVSLQAHVLYHRLQHDMSQGVYDKERFLQFLGYPRQQPYVNQEFLDSTANSRPFVDLSQDFSQITGFDPAAEPEALVRQYLRHFFQAGEPLDTFKKYIGEEYLRRLFAETKLLQGEGDLEQWYAWLDPPAVEMLTERVDLEFAAENKRRFAPEEPVRLDLWVKHVERLLVKVFVIDTKNYYQQTGNELNTDIDLNGLIANAEQVHEYTEPPLRSVRRSFEFPELQGRGVWVIEFVGGGKSSRAVVQKGRLQFLSRTSPAGQMITVFDETGRKLPDASVWFSGRSYAADKDGEVTLPFSTAAGAKSFVLCQSDFATLATFEHEAEQYQLTANFHVDAESLRAGTLAKVALRPLLQLNGTQAPVVLLKAPMLTVYSETHDGIVSTQQVPDFPLHNEEVSVHEFRVPQNLARLRFALSADIEPHTAEEPLHLNAEQQVEVNGINATQQTAAIFFSRFGEQYVIELRDKTGLPLAGRPINLSIKHRDFVDPVSADLKTTEQGVVFLGTLQDIEQITATAAGMTSQSWPVERATFAAPALLHGVTGEELSLPCMLEAAASVADAATLWEMRGSEFAADRTASLRQAPGYLVLSDLPAGDYLLHLKDSEQRVFIRLTAGARGAHYVASDARLLDIDQPTPLTIQAAGISGDQVRVQLAGATEFTRVHVTATRFLPDAPVYAKLANAPAFSPGVKAIHNGYTLYQSGRAIGDEFQYVLNRRFAQKFPGNMLERPSLLLNPWAIQETQAQQEEPAPPASPAAMAVPSIAQEAAAPAEAGEEAAREAGPPFSPCYDFLDKDAANFYNLKPDASGAVSIPVTDLHGRSYLRIVATDPYSTIAAEVALPEADVAIRDLRLAQALDPASHVIEQKRVQLLNQGNSVSVNQTGEMTLQIYDSIGSLYAL
ncbi:MAG: hypothetical protein HYZ00_06870, partial [Candidatus Hydrogenedentes bacterium]|nr:hypothetical protein [Candidatus Hydrogenedentota bacterium]